MASRDEERRGTVAQGGRRDSDRQPLDDLDERIDEVIALRADELAHRKRTLTIIAAGGLTLLLITVVFSIVASVGAHSASSAADAAKAAADKANHAIGVAQRNGATLDDLCEIARRQRRTLELSRDNSEQYLDSPAGTERTALNDFIRAISLPQLRARLEAETVPPSCRHPRRVRGRP